MKAMVRYAYGPPDVLQMEEVPTPVPRDNELLVRVRAASLNLGDWELLTGRPFFIAAMAHLFSKKQRGRLEAPEGVPRPLLLRPKIKILGCDLAGTVEAVGRNVTRFKSGDDVLGMSCFGACAQYMCISESSPLTIKPPDVSWEHAAALPQATFLAVQAIRDRGKVQDGQKVMIVGAGGGAGHLALQLAKARGAEATGVDREIKEEMMRSLGADHVVSIEAEDWRLKDGGYDLIFDLIGERSIFASISPLKLGGLYLAAGSGFNSFWQSILLGPLVSFLGRKQVRFLMASSPEENLRYVLDLMDRGVVRQTIDRCYPLEELPEAMWRIGSGRALGKVVLTI